jgi:hypothetical protein
VLTDPNYRVPSPPYAPDGVAWLRASVARFSNGATHQRRRALAVTELAAIDPDALRALALRRGTGPVEVLAEALGLPITVAEDIAVIAKSYQPHTTITPAADQAVDRLVRIFGASDERTANRIALLIQACDATAALVANTLAGRTDPPVPKTRRVAPDGVTVEADLTESPFGAGPHACPGRLHALALADGLVQAERAR